MRVTRWVAWVVLLSACALETADERDLRDDAPEQIGELGEALTQQEMANTAGASASYSTTTGSLERTGPFFESLGTNGRRCIDCHQAEQGFTITPSRLAMTFARTAGLDPVFRPVDGAISPTADVSTSTARRNAYKLLLARGVIRVGIGIPQDAEFDLTMVEDPAGYASARELSLFRRPLPATNLRFNAAVMWDGRESAPERSLDDALLQQSADATVGHAQASAFPSLSQQRAIVDFESALSTAQLRDSLAGSLFDLVNDVLGGPEPLASQPFYPGINDAFQGGPEGETFDPRVFTVFDGFDPLDSGSPEAEARASIARGQALFNSKPMLIRNVSGINDDPALGSPVALVGTCGTCHSVPNVGTSSVARYMDIGISGATRRIPEFPLYTLRNKTTGATVQSTDPGRALITGKWQDMQRFKVPGLRGLAARPPYFHNGQALTLIDVVDFYSGRFAMGMTTQERSDLVAFLRAL